VPSVLRCAKSNAWGRKNAVYMVVHRLFADETLTLPTRQPFTSPRAWDCDGLKTQLGEQFRRVYQRSQHTGPGIKAMQASLCKHHDEYRLFQPRPALQHHLCRCTILPDFMLFRLIRNLRCP
jgi:hypothetical protein